MIRFVAVQDGTVVEVWREGEFVGTIYPSGDGIKFGSAYGGSVHADIKNFAGAPLNKRLRGVQIDIDEERLT